MRKMNGGRLAALIGALLAASAVHAAEVAGVRIDDAVRVGTGDLVLNGAGVRSKLFFKVYVGALYVASKAATPAAVYDSLRPRRMLLRLLRDLDCASLREALDEGLRSNLDADGFVAIRPQADELAAIINSIGKAREGDTIALDFSAAGVAVSFNGEARGTVAGEEFGKALLRVWLGDRPADAALKKALLGG